MASLALAAAVPTLEIPRVGLGPVTDFQLTRILSLSVFMDLLLDYHCKREWDTSFHSLLDCFEDHHFADIRES